MAPTTCPSCGSDDVSFKPKKVLWKCDACNHEWAPTEELTPLRIFLSYGRDEFAKVAERIRDDLISRGHKVWFDKDKLKEGGDWEQYIEDGLKWTAKEPATGRIVFVMTPHSVRRPDGYCLNEIALALSKSVAIIPVMLVWSEPPLSIYRLQFLDMRDTYRHEDKLMVEGLYERKLERLAEALEHKNLDFQGGQSLMLKVLEPINFSADVFKFQKDFTGRQWVFDQVDLWLIDPEGSKLFWIIGDPGAGKSAIAAYLRDNRSQVAAFHFCDAASDEKRDPSKLVSSVACQLASQLPAYQERLSNLDLAGIKQEFGDPSKAYTLFDKLVVQPLAENFPEPDGTLVVIIDALDEATRGGKNEIVRFLAQSAEKTPKWLRFLLTSRPEQEVMIPLQTYKPFVLDASGGKNQEDLSAYLKSKIPTVTQAHIDYIMEKSEGIFLYVKQICEEIARGNLSLDRLQEFPRGLGGIYEQFFERQFGADPEYYQSEVIPLLYFVLAAQEPLTLGFLKAERGWVNNNELFLRLDKLGSMFPRTGNTDLDTLRPFHKSVADWLSVKANSGLWYVDLEWGQKLLADAGWRQFQSGPETMAPYFLLWLPEHLKRTSNHERLVAVLKSFRFMMARVANGALEQSLMDYRSLGSNLPPELIYEQAFFRERAHILRRQNDEWPAHKILLQLAVEHADNSPLTLGAEAWLEAGRCDWKWIRRIHRLDSVGVNPCIAVMEGHTALVTGVLARPDGTLVSWSYDGTLRLWSKEGDLVKVLKGHMYSVKGVLQRPDGTLLSWSQNNSQRQWNKEGDSLSRDHTPRLWSKEGDLLRVLEGHTNMVNGALERRDGTLLTWSDDNTLRLWSKEGDQLKVLEGHTNWVTGVLERSDGTIVSWSFDFTLRLWSKEGDLLKVLEGHTSIVKGMLLRPDGTLVSWARDNMPRLWSKGGDLLRVLEGHTSIVKGMLLRPDGTFVSWSLDFTPRLWSKEGDLLKVLEGHTSWVLGVHARPDGTLLTWSDDRALRLWSKEGDPLNVLDGHTDSVEGVLERPDGTVLTRSNDYTLRLWRTNFDQIEKLQGHTSHVQGVLERPDGTFISWSLDFTLRLWSKEGDLLKVLKGHTNWVDGVLERPDGTLLSWSKDNTLRLWSKEGDLLKVLEGHTGRIYQALERPDGTLLTWSSDRTLRLWSKEGDLLKVLEGHTKSVNGVLQRRDGTLLSWSRDTTLRLWNKEGHLLKVLEGHTNYVTGALERRDGTIVSWSDDQTLRLWSKEGDLLKVLKGHTNYVTGALERPDGTLVSFSWKDSLGPRLWSEEGDLLTVLSDKYVEPADFVEEPNGPRNIGNYYLDYSENVCVTRFEGDEPSHRFIWQSLARSSSKRLYANGRMVITQDDGQICFLQIYSGNQPISLEMD